MTKHKTAKAKRRKPRKRKPPLLPATLSPHQVLTFAQWCKLNTLSRNAARRILKDGKCKYVRLGKRRIGITVGANAEFQEAATVAV